MYICVVAHKADTRIAIVAWGKKQDIQPPSLPELVICPNFMLVGALSPVNHEVKWLYQGWKQTSIYRLVIHSTSHYTTSLFS